MIDDNLQRWNVLIDSELPISDRFDTEATPYQINDNKKQWEWKEKEFNDGTRQVIEMLIRLRLLYFIGAIA